MTPSENRNAQGALFILPSMPGPSAGPASTWIPAAGWASAALARWGNAWLVTPVGLLSPEEAFRVASTPRNAGTVKPRGLRLPVTMNTLKRDIRNVVRGFRTRNFGSEGPWVNLDLKFVWQRHELFQQSGARAARRFRSPFILFVDAPVVWESRQWGVNRPGWGRAIERLGESPGFRQADLICCISERVGEQVCRLGGREQKIMITPNTTDIRHFRPNLNVSGLRRDLGLSDCVLLGWVGSFRKFHGVERILEACAKLQRENMELGLLMIGDGFEHGRMVELSRTLDLQQVRFTGVVPYAELPRYINTMDIAVLTDSGNSEYHYSPLKLQEYMACGRAVIAPSIGQIAQQMHHGVDCLLVESGNTIELQEAIRNLYSDSTLRMNLGRAAREAADRRGGWDRVLDAVEARLGQ